MTHSITLHRHRSRRVPTILTAALRIGRRAVPVRVEDISRSGAKLRGARGLSHGLRLDLEAAGHAAPATVRWVRDDLCGIAFDATPPDPLLRGLAGPAAGRLLQQRFGRPVPRREAPEPLPAYTPALRAPGTPPPQPRRRPPDAATGEAFDAAALRAAVSASQGASSSSK